MTQPTYKPSVVPPELRVDRVGWDALLNLWEQQAIALYKKEFFRRGVEYVSLRGYLNTRVEEQIKLHKYEEFVYDSIPSSAESGQPSIEEERRLAEYIARLQRLAAISDCRMETNDIVLMRNSLHFPPATEADLQAAEQRLGKALPVSYREFLGVSNGWLMAGHPALLPVEKIMPLRDMAAEYIQEWLSHAYLHETSEFVVTPEPLGEGEDFVTHHPDIPTTCLNEAIVIGADRQEQAFLLLDPTTIDERGEWRAITLFRYEHAIIGRDFARLMEILYRLNCRA